MVPTKELAAQVTQHLKQLINYCAKEFKITNITTSNLEVNCQLEMNHIVVGTPSKTLQAVSNLSIPIKETLDFLVIDEADLLLSFGYEADVQKLLLVLPQLYQSFLMSATLNDKVIQLKSSIVKNPVILKLEDGGDDDLLSQFSLGYVIID